MPDGDDPVNNVATDSSKSNDALELRPLGHRASLCLWSGAASNQLRHFELAENNHMIKNVVIALGVVLVLLVLFIAWRWTSVTRGMRQRDEKLLRRLDPVAKRIETGQDVSPQEIAALAENPEIRFMLFAMLRELKRPELLPTKFSSTAAQGESALAYWMMHPNELQDAPAAIELVETVRRPIAGQESDFHVYRYKMSAGHWAAKDGWILGLAGPMKPRLEPYAEIPGAFSRVGDIAGKLQPSELVDWYVGMLRQKGMIQ